MTPLVYTLAVVLVVSVVARLMQLEPTVTHEETPGIFYAPRNEKLDADASQFREQLELYENNLQRWMLPIESTNFESDRKAVLVNCKATPVETFKPFFPFDKGSYDPGRRVYVLKRGEETIEVGERELAVARNHLFPNGVEAVWADDKFVPRRIKGCIVHVDKNFQCWVSDKDTQNTYIVHALTQVFHNEWAIAEFDSSLKQYVLKSKSHNPHVPVSV